MEIHNRIGGGMSQNAERFYVFTGGPGSGKSSLIAALHQRGYAHSIEAGRGIIRDQTGKTIWTGAHTEAVANLQAGRYVVRAETRSKRDERSVELRAGEAKLLEFSAD